MITQLLKKLFHQEPNQVRRVSIDELADRPIIELVHQLVTERSSARKEVDGERYSRLAQSLALDEAGPPLICLQPRRWRRVALVARAELRAAHGSQRCIVLDIGGGGLRVAGRPGLEIGEAVVCTVHTGGREWVFQCAVSWFDAKNHQYGLVFPAISELPAQSQAGETTAELFELALAA